MPHKQKKYASIVLFLFQNQNCILTYKENFTKPYLYYFSHGADELARLFTYARFNVLIDNIDQFLKTKLGLLSYCSNIRLDEFRNRKVQKYFIILI